MTKLIKGAFLALLLAFTTANADDFLDPNDAFKSEVIVENNSITVTWTIAEGYHLYADKMSITANSSAALGTLNLPKGEIKYDKVLEKDTEKFHGIIKTTIPIVSAQTSFDITLGFQGCAEAGLCYPPQERIQTINISNPITGSDENKIASALSSGSLWQISSLFLVLGVLLSFTPCVLPMVPILSSIIVGEGTNLTKTKGFVMSIAYSLGMALVYTMLGVAAGLAGEGLAGALQHPAVLSVFSLLLIGLALSMFDVYTLQMPSFVQSKLNDTSSKMPGGKLASVFVMGALSALVVGPCVAAPLAGALVYISKTRDVLIGGTALFSMALGMSVPLLLTGLSAGSLLPRAGKWMNNVKKFFGILLIGVAVWMVSPVFMKWFSKQEHSNFKTITNVAQLDQEISTSSKPIMLDFYADWCVACKEFEKFTFTDSRVAEKMNGYTLLRVDVTANDADGKALLKQFELFGPPGIILIEPKSGKVINKIIGYKKADEFITLL